MNTKRLLTLARHLRKVPVERFDMKRWACGTTACAMGHACTIPSFRRAGLRLVEDFGWGTITMSTIAFGKILGMQAAAELFDISYLTANRLFHAGNYPKPNPTPAEVAERIERLVREGKE
jgi:hypothetical protein